MAVNMSKTEILKYIVALGFTLEKSEKECVEWREVIKATGLKPSLTPYKVCTSSLILFVEFKQSSGSRCLTLTEAGWAVYRQIKIFANEILAPCRHFEMNKSLKEATKFLKYLTDLLSH